MVAAIPASCAIPLSKWLVFIRPSLAGFECPLTYPLLFATISGAHLYGFPSPDSDFDLRGAHVLPLEKIVGLDVHDETIQDSCIIDGLDMDIVSHDVKKFFGMLLKKNGYVLEQLFSPLIVHTTPEHEELKSICRSRGRKSAPLSGNAGVPVQGPESVKSSASPASSSPSHPSVKHSPDNHSSDYSGGVITKHHAHHYFGFAETQWKLFLKESPRRVKPLLYVYRVLLTGIHLMRTGEIEANIVTLNQSFRLPYINDLVTRKLTGTENLSVGQLLDSEIAFHESEYNRLRAELQTAYDASQLPELPSDATRAALNDLLLRLRLHTRPIVRVAPTIRR